MKKIFLACLFICPVLVPATSYGQSRKNTGIIDNATTVSYALPRTVLTVTLTADKESVRTGPFARYAQKYLGVMAPLSDKDTYVIRDASIGYYDEADPNAVYVMDNAGKAVEPVFEFTEEGLVALPKGWTPRPKARTYEDGSMYTAVSHTHIDTAFVKVPVNRMSITDGSAESMAQEAAETIFLLRKRRMELVTGDAGENVFGAGLAAALEELDRMENEYLALFLGKQFRETMTRTFDVIPEADKNSIVVCRFSPASGFQPATELSANPIVVNLTKENKTSTTAVARNTRDSKGLATYRIADIVQCRVMNGRNEIASQRIPIFQMGAEIDLPAAAVK